MKRRQLIRYAQAGLLATVGTGLTSVWQSSQAQTKGGLSIQWLGHSCFLFSGDSRRILVNPFRSIGCTAKYRPPKAAADLVLISSQLLDEGYVEIVPGNPRLLFEAGLYQFRGSPIQGITMDHDRVGGRRFGTNVAWRWTQNGMNILHLGGAASPVTLDQQILMGRPDILLVPIGGGPKAYNPQEARQAIDTLKPRIIVPTQYRTGASDPNACDLVAIDAFLSLMGDTQVRRLQSDTVSLNRGSLPDKQPVTLVFSYKL